MKIKLTRQYIEAGHPRPSYETNGSAGIDLRTMTDLTLKPSCAVLVGTGLHVAIPTGYAGFVYPRSGRGHKEGLILGNGTGVIDSDYRGEVMVSLFNRSRYCIPIEAGERVAQLVIQPVAQPSIEIVDDLDATGRGAGGFGSTGR